MDFYFNVRFDSWEEYSAFCTHAETYFQQGKPNVSTQPKSIKTERIPKKALPKSALKLTEKVASPAPKPVSIDPLSVLHLVPGYTPSKGLVIKVNAMIAKKQSFNVVDVAKGAIKNSNYKARVNRWLQAHPALFSSRDRTLGNGRGLLIYTPLENGKALLPPGEKPKKTDWPTKGASYRLSHAPKIENDDEERELEVFNDLNVPDAAKVH